MEKRRYITVGFLGFVLLIPLAITSTAGWILPPRAASVGKRCIDRSTSRRFAVVIHYYWLVKSDVRNPLFYAALVSILLLWRLGDCCRKKGRFSAREKQKMNPRFRQRFPSAAGAARRNYSPDASLPPPDASPSINSSPQKRGPGVRNSTPTRCP